MKKLSLLSLCIFLFAFAAQAQTTINGGIYSNTTWTKANSPYIITNDVVVFAGVTLLIEPGVKVKFNSGTGLELRGKTKCDGNINRHYRIYIKP